MDASPLIKRIMGLDLRLLPFDCDQDRLSFSHTILQFCRNSELFSKIQKLNQLEVPDGFTSFSGRADGWDDTCYGETVKTPYGEPLTYTTATELASIAERSQWDAPTWAYIDALDPKTKIALYWH